MDNICLFFNCQQMALTIYFSGNFCLAFFHEWTLSFNIVMGAPNNEVVPELDNIYGLPFLFGRRLSSERAGTSR